jgi:hypothetical protein
MLALLAAAMMRGVAIVAPETSTPLLLLPLPREASVMMGCTSLINGRVTLSVAWVTFPELVLELMRVLPVVPPLVLEAAAQTKSARLAPWPMCTTRGAVDVEVVVLLVAAVAPLLLLSAVEYC